jgi:hypothetical protein
MKHLSDEELLEHCYGEGAGAAGGHIESCAECAQAYAALQADLAGLHAVEPPARDAAYGEQVWHAIEPSLPVYGSPKRTWQRLGLWRGLSFAAACALLVAAAFFAGRLWEHRQPRITAAKAPPPPQQVVLVLLGDHLDRSERLLVELKHTSADSTEMISPLRDEASTLLAANGMRRQDARRIGDPALATTLDQLNKLLGELAKPSGTLDPAAIARLQKEASADNLLFEVRVLRSRIPDQGSSVTTRSRGGKI